MTETINEKLCPFCQSSNHCMAHEAQTCWCSKTKIEKGLIALVPPEKKKKACICFSCNQTYKENPAKFEKQLLRN
ncbi:hypothetical protein A9Q79_02670 [Methylophaga sp. 42_25_T18]|nr:hypothetical protein A9Q79_02670 [Methylophaga sp. 42_25_T18]